MPAPGNARAGAGPQSPSVVDPPNVRIKATLRFRRLSVGSETIRAGGTLVRVSVNPYIVCARQEYMTCSSVLDAVTPDRVCALLAYLRNRAVSARQRANGNQPLSHP